MIQRICKYLLCLMMAASSLEFGRYSAQAQRPTEQAIDVGTRVEMFVDDQLIDPMRRRGISLELQTPVRQEVVLTTDKPWEGIFSAYFTILQDGPKFRLYYRGSGPVGDHSERQYTCYAESTDGTRFTRPNLGLHEFEGSKENNILLSGIESHNFAPFLDTNPAAKPDERYKALAGLGSKLYAFGSGDGLHWRKLQAEPVMTKGTFDSLNLAFWDTQAKCYRAYSRYFDRGGYQGYRAIQNCQSPDFLHWEGPQPNHFAAGVPMAHFYTNATFPCPGAPHHYLAFPMRFVPERKKIAEMNEPGVSDAVFMSSRDGQNWDRTHLVAWLRPGMDQHNWTHRSNMPAWGIVQTGPGEFSMYVSEHYGWPDNRLRRITVRRHGFSSAHAGAGGGVFTTRPLLFSGDKLRLNYATSAAGSIAVEIQDQQGKTLPGYSLAEMKPVYGDELDAAISWQSRKDVADVAGKPVRLHIVMQDADLFSFRTTKTGEKLQASVEQGDLQ
jgi:hypothetical protein